MNISLVALLIPFKRSCCRYQPGVISEEKVTLSLLSLPTAGRGASKAPVVTGPWRYSISSCGASRFCSSSEKIINCLFSRMFESALVSPDPLEKVLVGYHIAIPHSIFSLFLMLGFYPPLILLYG